MDVAVWLTKLGLEQYELAFRGHDIDSALLTELSDTDLERIGVASLGHQRRLMKAIAQLDAPAPYSQATTTLKPI